MKTNQENVQKSDIKTPYQRRLMQKKKNYKQIQL